MHCDNCSCYALATISERINDDPRPELCDKCYWRAKYHEAIDEGRRIAFEERLALAVSENQDIVYIDPDEDFNPVFVRKTALEAIAETRMIYQSKNLTPPSDMDMLYDYLVVHWAVIKP